MVNLLITILIKVNVPISDMSRRETTGDDHEEQESTPDPRSLVVADWLRLERRRQHWLIEIRPFSAEFGGILDDLLLGADRLSASGKPVIWRTPVRHFDLPAR